MIEVRRDVHAGRGAALDGALAGLVERAQRRT
jgi:hypothetical protein